MAIILGITGLLAGVLSGLAIGGGTLLVPALILLLGIEQHQAQAVALTAFLPVSSVAIITHYRAGNIRPRLALYLVLGAIIGAFCGALLATHLPGPLLRKIFGMFLIGMGVYEIVCRPPKTEKNHPPDQS